MKFLLSILLLVCLIGIGIGIMGLNEKPFTMTPVEHTQEYYDHKACDEAVRIFNETHTIKSEKDVARLCDGK